MHRKSKKVQRWGVEMFGSAGSRRAFWADDLAGLVGQEVEVFYDPQNIGELIVYKDNRFLCKAHNRELLDFGASKEDIKREQQIKSRQRKSVAERHQELLMQAQYPNPLARAQAETRYANVVQEEREKIAVNARANSVSVLLPKFAQAAKRLQEVGRGSRIEDRGSPCGPKPTGDGSKDAIIHRPSSIIDEGLRSSEDIFAAQDDGDLRDELKDSDELFGGED
jgi:hypothetical protein